MRKKIFLWAALSWSGIILVSCLIQSNNIPNFTIPNLDKLAHAFFYFVFASLWFLYFKKQIDSRSIFKPLTISFVFSFFFGIGIEILQAILTTTRKADILGVFANVSGSLVAVIALILLNKYNGIIDKI